MLFATAIKCNIPRKKALADALSLVPILDARTREKEPFTKDDVMAAYREAYESGADKSDLMHRLPTKWIVENTEIELPITKRNGRSRIEHLQAEIWRNENGRPTANVCRQNRELVLGDMRDKGEISGRPSKAAQIRAWREAHPAGRKIDCHRETGMSRMTIDKWWDE